MSEQVIKPKKISIAGCNGGKARVMLIVILVLVVAVTAGVAAYLIPKNRKRVTLAVGDASIDNEVFAYYYSLALADAEKDGSDLLNTEELIKKAVDKCCRYTACVTLFRNYGLSLDTDARKRVEESTENKWKLYSHYYEDCGISKQTIAKICIVDEYRTGVLLYVFGPGGPNEISDRELKAYYNKNYVTFKAINGYFTETDLTGQVNRLTDKKIEELRAEFAAKQKKMEGGFTIDEVSDGATVPVTFSSVDDSAYPAGFLKEIQELKYDEPKVIETDDNIFLVVKVNPDTEELDYFERYRTSYIDKLRGTQMDEALVEASQSFTVKRFNDQIYRTAKTVTDARNSRKGK